MNKKRWPQSKLCRWLSCCDVLIDHIRRLDVLSGLGQIEDLTADPPTLIKKQKLWAWFSFFLLSIKNKRSVLVVRWYDKVLTVQTIKLIVIFQLKVSSVSYPVILLVALLRPCSLVFAILTMLFRKTSAAVPPDSFQGENNEKLWREALKYWIQTLGSWAKHTGFSIATYSMRQSCSKCCSTKQLNILNLSSIRETKLPVGESELLTPIGAHEISWLLIVLSFIYLERRRWTKFMVRATNTHIRIFDTPSRIPFFLSG